MMSALERTALNLEIAHASLRRMQVVLEGLRPDAPSNHLAIELERLRGMAWYGLTMSGGTRTAQGQPSDEVAP
jgi:hypothetical protein